MIDSIKLVGHVTVTLKNKKGEIVDVIDESNFIVDAGKKRVARLLGIGSEAGIINKMAIGDKGHDGDLFNPKTPDALWGEREELFGYVYEKPNDSGSPIRPDEYTIEFLNTFDASDPGIDPGDYHTSPIVINEAGLLIENPAGGNQELFAIKTFKSVPFDPSSGLSLIIQWRITVQ